MLALLVTDLVWFIRVTMLVVIELRVLVNWRMEGMVVVKASAFVITSDSPCDNGYPSCSRIGSTSGEYFHLLIQLTH